jgi:hypothetical protein
VPKPEAGLSAKGADGAPPEPMPCDAQTPAGALAGEVLVPLEGGGLAAAALAQHQLQLHQLS